MADCGLNCRGLAERVRNMRSQKHGTKRKPVSESLKGRRIVFNMCTTHYSTRKG